MNSKWGTYDEKVFSKQMKDMDTVKQPFFSTILTLTNHEPFELPVKSHFPGDDVENKFRSTTFYTDSCLGAYLKEAKKKPLDSYEIISKLEAIKGQLQQLKNEL